MILAQDIKAWIEQGINGVHVEIEGDGQHFFATIVSEQFEGKTRIQRHQMVYQALGDKMVTQIHALSMKTLTPQQVEA